MSSRGARCPDIFINQTAAPTKAKQQKTHRNSFNIHSALPLRMTFVTYCHESVSRARVIDRSNFFFFHSSFFSLTVISLSFWIIIAGASLDFPRGVDRFIMHRYIYSAAAVIYHAWANSMIDLFFNGISRARVAAVRRLQNNGIILGRERWRIGSGDLWWFCFCGRGLIGLWKMHSGMNIYWNFICAFTLYCRARRNYLKLTAALL